MAKRARAKSGQFVKSGGGRTTTKIIAVAPAPVRRRRRSATVTVKRRASPRRKSSSGVAGFLGSKPRTSIVLGSAALGFATQQGWLAKLPLIGSAGPITSFAILGWGAEELAKIRLPSLVHDMVTSALAISAFNIGSTAGTPGGIKVVGEESYHYPGGAAFYG